MDLRSRVEAASSAFNARDPTGIYPLVSPDLRLYSFRAGLEGPYIGHEGVARFLRDVESDWTGLRVTETHAVEADGKLVLITARMVGQGAQSGAAVDARIGFVWVLGEDGLIEELHCHTQAAAARAEYVALRHSR